MGTKKKKKKSLVLHLMWLRNPGPNQASVTPPGPLSPLGLGAGHLWSPVFMCSDNMPTRPSRWPRSLGVHSWVPFALQGICWGSTPSRGMGERGIGQWLRPRHASASPKGSFGADPRITVFPHGVTVAGPVYRYPSITGSAMSGSIFWSETPLYPEGADSRGNKSSLTVGSGQHTSVSNQRSWPCRAPRLWSLRPAVCSLHPPQIPALPAW